MRSSTETKEFYRGLDEVGQSQRKSSDKAVLAIPGVLFPKKPLIRFAPNPNRCPRCYSVSQVWQTRTREVATLRIGHFTAHETQRYCPRCSDQPVFLPEELQQLVPPGARYYLKRNGRKRSGNHKS